VRYFATSVRELIDFRDEDEKTLAAYGPETKEACVRGFAQL
jgi:hypothetical protein